MARRRKTKKISASLAEPRRAKIKKTTTKAVKSSREEKTLAKQSVTQNLIEQLKLGESYISLILGAVVVFAFFLIIFIFMRQGDLKNSSLPAQKTIKTTIKTETKTYVLQEGEGLWDVAVKFYGDGYKWTEIANANHMDEETSDYVEPGTKLIIPNVK